MEKAFLSLLKDRTVKENTIKIAAKLDTQMLELIESAAKRAEEVLSSKPCQGTRNVARLKESRDKIAAFKVWNPFSLIQIC